MNSASRYHVGDLIYASANSKVFRGYRVEDGLPVICKVMQKELLSPERRARFRQEYELMHQLHSDGIATAYSLEPYQESHMLVLEDFGGTSLNNLDICAALPLAEWLPLAIRITECLGQLHDQNIMHKDINPSNIVWNRNDDVVKLIDLGNATKLSREVPEVRNPEWLEGSLFYLSPEQTGRMNRAMDYRTDFYSLGVTFYELLSGQLPFPADDALELVHAHIAKRAQPVSQIKPDIPEMVCAVIDKLMAKTAEERYQSAAGLKADLQTCFDTLDEHGRIPAFELGQHDFSSRLQIPQKLYGRKTQIAALLDAYNRSSQGPGELLLVAGYSGIGKSALVHEVQKPITQSRGYFIEGKFDQFKRDIPYASLAQAFKELIQQLLTEGEAAIAEWKDKLLHALGNNAQVIIDVIPGLELIVGPQPKVLEMPPAQAQNRFNHEFRNFLGALTSVECPLAIFLDDLQWADLPSLQLMSLLLQPPATPHLLLIGAYRDNEITPGHALTLILKEMEKSGVAMHAISLPPLQLAEISELLCDTLHVDAQQAKELAHLCLAKTQGNPFFLNQFLSTLADRGILRPDAAQGCWEWDIASIEQAGITDNIVDLMVQKLHKLPPATQQVLQGAACLGNVFDLKMLAIVCALSDVQTAELLWDALREELIVPLDDHYKYVGQSSNTIDQDLSPNYRFLHDRVQQAAYMLDNAQDKLAMHLAIGRLWLKTYSIAEQQAMVFELANHLNLGRELMTDPAERRQLAQLNLTAARRAKASAAYKPALNYLQVATELVSDEDWDCHYSLMIALYTEAAEVAHLVNEAELMESYISNAFAHVNNLVDKIKLYEIQIRNCTEQNKQREATFKGIEALRLCGISFPRKPNKLHVVFSLLQTQLALKKKSMEDLVCMPNMTEPVILAAHNTLLNILNPAYHGAPKYLPLFLLKAIRYTLKHGHGPGSGVNFASLGLVISSVLGKSGQGAQFAEVALGLQQRHEMSANQCRAMFVTHALVNPWVVPLQQTVDPLKDVFFKSLEIGDFEYGRQAITISCLYSFYSGGELTELDEATAEYCGAWGQIDRESGRPSMVLFRQTMQNLMGHAPDPRVLEGSIVDRQSILQIEQMTDNSALMLILYGMRLMLCYLFGAYKEAFDYAAIGEKHTSALGFFAIAILYFYNALNCIALLREGLAEDRTGLLRKVKKNQKKMARWSKHAPSNFLHKWYLVEAELAGISGKKLKAIEYYEQAITLAKESDFLNEEALARELAGQYAARNGMEGAARGYLRGAQQAYRRWGALAKVRDLAQRYPQWCSELEVLAPSMTYTTRTLSVSMTGMSDSGTLDFATAMKASQALSKEIVLEKLLKRLMEVAVENAGAQRGVLLLKKDKQWSVEAVKRAEQTEATVLQALALDESNQYTAPLPLSLLHYVAHTREGLVIQDALEEKLLANDAYVQTFRPRSLLVVPILHHGEMTGLLYLENSAVSGAFTENRLQVLHLLASQAAISIENARLYANMEDRVSARTAELAQSVETLRQLGEVGRVITANLDTDAVFDALHRHLGRLLDMSTMAIYGASGDGTMLEPVFARHDGQALVDLESCRIDSSCHVARAARERQEVLVVAETEAEAEVPGVARGGRFMRTSLFAPLVVDERMLGVMVVQSERSHAYGERERMIFQALCAYGAIALDNAGTYRHLQATLKTLSRTQIQLLERNQELARVNKLQEEQQSELTRFLAVASHDMRQPMHSLNLYLGALSNYELPEPARPVLGNVRQCAQIMDDMFLALLDLSRLDAQVVAPHIEHFPIASLLSRIAVEFAPQAKDKGLQLRVAPCSAWVQSDPALVEQILRNLTANAVRYTESGGIVIGCRRRGARLRLAVFDTGIGIAADQQKSVFEEFCQIGNTGRDRTKGLGLGLAIVRRLARLLDTPITLESEPEKGSMFAIDLQRIDPFQSNWQRKPLWTTVLDTPAGSMQDHLAGKLIVVVDDEISILDAMRVLLEQWGCTVVTALSGREALASLSLSMRAPDVLICDYRLRLSENGLDVIRMLQSEFNLDIPVLIITGTITPARMKEITLSGVPVLHKPVNAASLRKSLLQIVERH
ncbi:AAA family ATPase [Herbaspirillum sp. ST 5-3]|uniref:AAA family ATPase n=1 Tax=Oxalobacteraceae TaxID=75682 RepID=UPI0010A309F5|nr:AAA family ATPase [Herbaspirillum sp. ST 5-3]